VKLFSRIFWLISLAFFLSGCTGYQMLGTTEIAGEETLDFSGLDELATGDDVRITLHGGDRVEGKLAELGAHSVVLDVVAPETASLEEIVIVPSANPQDQVQRQEFAFVDMVSLEKKKDDSDLQAVRIAAGALVLGVLAYWMIREGSSDEVPPLIEISPER